MRHENEWKDQLFTRCSHVGDTGLTDASIQCFAIVFERSGTIDQIGMFRDRLEKSLQVWRWTEDLESYIDDTLRPGKSFQRATIESRENGQIGIEIVQPSKMLIKEIVYLPMERTAYLQDFEEFLEVNLSLSLRILFQYSRSNPITRSKDDDEHRFVSRPYQ